MSYSFKDDIVARLPAGHQFVRMYSSDPDTTSIETNVDGVKNVFMMEKVDLSTYFTKLPTIALGADKTYNDLYDKISDIYGLGLQRNVDYYNSTPLEVTSAPRYVELPISVNSYGYKGTVRCLVALCEFTGMCEDMIKDISREDIQLTLYHLKFRNYLAGNLFQTDPPLFIENHLSTALIDAITENLDKEVAVGAGINFKEELTNCIVVDVFSDGISDIAVLLTSSRELYHLRFKSEPDDLPVIKNYGSRDVKTDDSKGLLVGDRGDLITGERSELPYSSTEGKLTPEEDTELEIQ